TRRSSDLQTVDADLAGPRDRYLADGSGIAIPDAGRRVAHGLPHTMANASRRQAAARATRRRRSGRRESRLHVRGGLREGLQADPGADARKGQATAPVTAMSLSACC